MCSRCCNYYINFCFGCISDTTEIDQTMAKNNSKDKQMNSKCAFVLFSGELVDSRLRRSCHGCVGCELLSTWIGRSVFFSSE